MRIVDCAYCGRAFETSHSQKKYCSDECRLARERERVREATRKRYHERKAADPGWLERIYERRRIRWVTDPAYRERMLEGQRIKWVTSARLRERVIARQKEKVRIKRATDSEWVKRQREIALECYHRAFTDPEQREKIIERWRNHHRKKAIIIAAVKELRAEGKKPRRASRTSISRTKRGRANPEWREQELKKTREHRRIKRATDPEYRERQKASARKGDRKRRATIAAVRELKAEAKQRVANAGLLKPPPEGD